MVFVKKLSFVPWGVFQANQGRKDSFFSWFIPWVLSKLELFTMWVF